MSTTSRSDALAPTRILLVGMMASGKTTVGHELAAITGWPYVDNDELVVSLAGQATPDVATELVLHNNVVVGSVNANRRHFYRAAQALAAADPGWLERLISRRVPPARIAEAFDRGPDDIKVVVDFAAAS